MTSLDWLRPLSSEGGIRRAGLRAIAMVGASQIIKLTVNVVGTFVLVRLLVPDAFGLAAMAALLFNLILLFKDLGFGTAIVQSTELTQRQASTLFWLLQLAGFGFCLLGIASAPLLAWFFAEPELLPALMVLSVGFLFSTLGSQHTALLARNLRFATLGVIEIVALCLGLGTALLLAVLDQGWWSLIWQRLVQLAATTVGTWMACNWRPAAQFAVRDLRLQIHLGLHVTSANVAGYASRNAANLLIGWYWGAAPLGLYSKAYDLLMAPLNQVAAPLGQALQPVLGRLRDDPQRYRILLTHAVTASLLVLLPVGTLMAWQASTVTRVLLGEPWLAAAPVMGWFGLLVCFHLCGSILTWSLISRQRGGDLSRTTLVNAAISLCGFMLSVPFGITAVAATYTLLGALVRTPYFLYICSGDEFFPRSSVIQALPMPVVAFGLLSALYAMLDGSAVLATLSGWQSLLLQLSVGYGLMVMLVLPSPLGRFVLRRGRVIED